MGSNQLLERPPGFIPREPRAVLYSGPAVPIAYDANWQLFTDLTKDQIAWFQAQPEWAAKVASHNAFLQSKGISDFSASQTAAATPVK